MKVYRGTGNGKVMPFLCASSVWITELNGDALSVCSCGYSDLPMFRVDQAQIGILHLLVLFIG
jgi:hypothetical protein